jgi:hypothetical protein
MFAKVFMSALMESRKRKARREIAMHIHLLPEDVLKKAGCVARVKRDGADSFTR